MFSKRDQFCSFWDQFCRFAYLIRLGDHFCAGITFAAVQAPSLISNEQSLTKFEMSTKTERLYGNMNENFAKTSNGPQRQVNNWVAGIDSRSIGHFSLKREANSDACDCQ